MSPAMLPLGWCLRALMMQLYIPQEWWTDIAIRNNNNEPDINNECVR